MIVVTQRKPGNVTWPGWIESQIRDAERSGAFENLPGKGEPIRGLDRPRDDQAWVADWLRREQVDAAEVLPPALALAKEVETLPARLRRERSEVRVREIVDRLNRRIDRAHAAPQVGPPVRVRLVDTEAVVADWRATRPEPAPVAAAAPPQPSRRRWFGRR